MLAHDPEQNPTRDRKASYYSDRLLAYQTEKPVPVKTGMGTGFSVRKCGITKSWGPIPIPSEWKRL
jgi:hypothetical protein